jgi:hypothetical protein
MRVVRTKQCNVRQLCREDKLARKKKVAAMVDYRVGVANLCGGTLASISANW